VLIKTASALAALTAAVNDAWPPNVAGRIAETPGASIGIEGKS
jgi:hypothetical protein